MTGRVVSWFLRLLILATIGPWGPCFALELREIKQDLSLRSIGTLRVLNGRGSVSVRPWTQPRIRARAVVSLADEKLGEMGEDERERVAQSVALKLSESSKLHELRVEVGSGFDIHERLDERKRVALTVALELWVPTEEAVEIWGAVGDFSVFGRKAAVQIRAESGSIDVSAVEGAVSLSCLSCAVKLREIEGNLSVLGGDRRIALQGITARSIHVEASSENIEAEDMRGSQEYITQSGNISLKRASGRLSFATDSGEVKFEAVSGPVMGKSRSGAIWVDVVQWPPSERASIESESGGIEVHLPSSLSAELDVSTWSGDLMVALPVKILPVTVAPGEKRQLARLGEGGERIRLASKSGAVRVLRSTY